MRIDEAINTTFKSEQQKAIVNIRYTSNFLSNIQNNFMLKFELTMPQFNVLRILRGANESLMTQTIKDRMVEKSPNTTRLLDKLESKKFIERKQDKLKDKRAVIVSITQKGLEVLNEIDKGLIDNNLLNIGLDNNEAIQLSNLLDKLRVNFQK